MSVNINNVTVGGNLTRDPTVRYLAGDTAVAEFTLAINRYYKSKDGGKKEEVAFVPVKVWGKQAELVGTHLAKGKPCVVVGRLITESWENNDGKKQSKTLVVATDVHILEWKDKEQAKPEPADPPKQEEDDVPF